MVTIPQLVSNSHRARSLLDYEHTAIRHLELPRVPHGPTTCTSGNAAYNLFAISADMVVMPRVEYGNSINRRHKSCPGHRQAGLTPFFALVDGHAFGTKPRHTTGHHAAERWYVRHRFPRPVSRRRIYRRRGITGRQDRLWGQKCGRSARARGLGVTREDRTTVNVALMESSRRCPPVTLHRSTKGRQAWVTRRETLMLRVLLRVLRLSLLRLPLLLWSLLLRRRRRSSTPRGRPMTPVYPPPRGRRGGLRRKGAQRAVTSGVAGLTAFKTGNHRGRGLIGRPTGRYAGKRLCGRLLTRIHPTSTC